MTKTDIVKADQALPPSHLDDDEFGSYAGQGMENVTSGDLLVPRLTILQALSPQLKPRDSAHIPGAAVGTICDVGVGELFPDGLLFLPVYYRKDYLEWAPRATGKGLVGVHGDPAILDQTVRDEKNRPILPNGNLIAETAQFFGINLTAGRRKCFLPMASTQLRKAKKWLMMTTGERLKRADGSDFVAPIWYRTYHLTTADESNNEGDWSGWVINRGAAIKDLDLGFDWRSLKEEAIEFREALIKGEAKADTAGMDAGGPAAGATDDGVVM
jgi:hypothetical protein